jgi:hypothetical protein
MRTLRSRPPSRGRCTAKDMTETPFGLTRLTLRKPKARGSRGRGTCTAATRPGPRTVAQQVLDRPLHAARHHHPRAERQQRGGEVAIGVRREQVAADGGHVAHLRPAHRPHHRMQEAEVGMGRDGRHGDPSADLHRIARRPDLGQGRVRAAHHAPLHLPGIDVAHHDGAATEIDAVRSQRALRLGDRRMVLTVTAISRPPAQGSRGWP